VTVHKLVSVSIQTDKPGGVTKLWDLLECLFRQGRWFMVEPWPNAHWRVSVHEEPGIRTLLVDLQLKAEDEAP
jgi:hypothetical protein